MFKLVNVHFIILLFALNKSETKNVFECNPQNCQLPMCKCSSTDMPRIDFDQTPMMIALSFSGAVNNEVMDQLEKLLDFKNPNGCPIKGTFFVADTVGNLKTSYCLVQNLFDRNNEIGIGAQVNTNK